MVSLSLSVFNAPHSVFKNSLPQLWRVSSLLSSLLVVFLSFCISETKVLEAIYLTSALIFSLQSGTTRSLNLPIYTPRVSASMCSTKVAIISIAMDFSSLYAVLTDILIAVSLSLSLELRLASRSSFKAISISLPLEPSNS